MRKAKFVFAAVSLLFTWGRAQADMTATINLNGQDYTQSGPTSASVSGNNTVGDPNTALGEASASALSSITGGGLNQSAAAAVTLIAANRSSGSIFASDEALASYQDRVHLSTTDPSVVGNIIRYNFQVGGEIRVPAGAPQGSPAGGSSALQYGATTQVVIGSDLTNERGTVGEQNFLDPVYSGWDSLSLTTSYDYSGGSPGSLQPTAVIYSFSGTLHADGYIQTPTGSTLTVQSIVEAGGEFSFLGTTASVGITAFDPLQFLSITLPDKGNVTPESLGVSVTFDSGLLSPNITSVPAPPLPVLLASAAFCGGLVWWRRRNRPLLPA